MSVTFKRILCNDAINDLSTQTYCIILFTTNEFENISCKCFKCHMRSYLGSHNNVLSYCFKHILSKNDMVIYFFV